MIQHNTIRYITLKHIPIHYTNMIIIIVAVTPKSKEEKVFMRVKAQSRAVEALSNSWHSFMSSNLFAFLTQLLN